MNVKYCLIKKTVTVFNYIRDGRECKGFIQGKLNAARKPEHFNRLTAPIIDVSAVAA